MQAVSPEVFLLQRKELYSMFSGNPNFSKVRTLEKAMIIVFSKKFRI